MDAAPTKTDTLAPLLGSILNEPKAYRPVNTNDYRRYISSVMTSTMIAGNRDTDIKRIVYEIGRRHESAERALDTPLEEVLRLNAGHDNSPTLADEVRGLAKKHSNFSGCFRQSSLSGVVERLAKGIAAWSVFTGVNSDTLLSGMPLQISALEVQTTPVEADRASVFIPRIVDALVAPNVFSVLCCAVAGEGGRVVTDKLAVDATTHAAIIPTTDTHSFPSACVDALRLIGANMAESGAGDLFALAVTRGLHHVLTLVGHTDEGGVIRSVLRKCAYEKPFGIIHTVESAYIGLPALASSSLAAVAGWCDGLVMMTGAAVAHCDPGVVRQGDWFPTVFTATEGADITLPGMGQSSTPAGVANIRNALADDSPRFCRLYCAALAKLFSFAETSGVAEILLSAMFAALPNTERHLQFACVAPYFWVEPTSLIDKGMFGTIAEAEGFGSYADKMSSSSVYGWEGFENRTTGVFSHTLATVKFRSARTSALLAHFRTHPRDGLGAVIPRQLETEGVVLPGPNAEHPTVLSRLRAGDDISKYLWTRGQSPFPAPAEFINTGVYMGLRIMHFGVDVEGDITPLHMIEKDAIQDAIVDFKVSIPIGATHGPCNSAGSAAQRARTRAAVALHQVRLRAAQFGLMTVDDMPLLNSAPRPCIAGGGGGDRDHHMGGVGRAQGGSGDAGPPGNAGAHTRRERLFPTVHHQPDRGPQIRRGANVVGPTNTPGGTQPGPITGGGLAPPGGPQPPVGPGPTSAQMRPVATASLGMGGQQPVRRGHTPLTTSAKRALDTSTETQAKRKATTTGSVAGRTRSRTGIDPSHAGKARTTEQDSDGDSDIDEGGPSGTVAVDGPAAN